MRRLCIILYEPEPGGQATHVQALVEGLRGGPFQMTVIANRPRPTWARAIAGAGARLQPFEGSKWGIWLQMPRLVSHLRREQPELLHLHGQFAGTWGRLAARWAGVPLVIYTPHAVQIGSRILRPFYAAAERLLGRGCDAIIYVSQHDANLAQRRGWARPDQVVVIPNGVHMESLRQRAARGIEPPLEKPEGVRWVLQAGRLHPQKGTDLLLAAARRVIARHRDTHFLLAGEGPLAERLAADARRGGIENHIHFLGWRDDLPGLMAASDVIVLASRWEAMPYALLEAMALSKPCVATAVGGVPEIIQDGVHGRLVPPEDPAALADALLALLADPQRGQVMGWAAAARVLSDFSLARMVGKSATLYRRLLGLPEEV